MELTFSSLRAKEVINVQDGKKLGRICDVVLCYPENKWIGMVVPSSRGFSLKRNELFISLKQVQKIGEDVILVSVGTAKKDGEKQPCDGKSGCERVASVFEHRRNFEEFE